MLGIELLLPRRVHTFKTTDTAEPLPRSPNTQLTLSWTPLRILEPFFHFSRKVVDFHFSKVCVYENLNVETRPRDRQRERERGRSATETERGEGARPGGGVGQGREGGVTLVRPAGLAREAESHPKNTRTLKGRRRWRVPS